MDSEHAREQLGTLKRLRRRIRHRLDRPVLLIFALGVFLCLALKQFGERTEWLSVTILPILYDVYQSRIQATASRHMSRAKRLLTVVSLLLWIMVFISLGYLLGTFGWTFAWPLVGLLAALPLVFLAWQRRA